MYGLIEHGGFADLQIRSLVLCMREGRRVSHCRDIDDALNVTVYSICSYAGIL